MTRPFFTSFFPSHFLTLALDTVDGAVLWVETFRGGNGPARLQVNVVRDIGISPNGDSVYVVGHQASLGDCDDYLTIAYDASTGDERWVRRYDGASNGEDRPAALAVSADNTVIVTGTSFEIGQAANVVTVAYDGSDGTQRWSSSFDGAAYGRDAARTMSLSPDGADLIVSGSSAVGSTETRSSDVLVLDLNPATGTLRWSTIFDEAGPHERGWISAITQEQVFVGVLVGTVDPFSSSPYDFAVVALELVAGQRAWGQDTSDLAELVVAPSGAALFAVGTGSSVEPSYDVIAYGASTGTVLWSASWEPLRPNHARGAAIAPDSSTLYVTGQTQSQEGSTMATVALDTS